MMPTIKFNYLNVVTIIISCLYIFATHVNAETIKIGMSTALKGPAALLGINVKMGVDAYFKKVNDNGGIGGKKIILQALDDGYEPVNAAKNMRQLIEKHNVLTVIGNVGTPTAVVTVPIANQLKTSLFGAVTGAGLLRKNPPDRYIINYRASYAEETANMINGLLLAGIKPNEFAFFTQEDGYGDAGYIGAINALKATGFDDIDSLAHGRYKRNTINVERALSVILNAETEPKAIILVGAYKPSAAFIKLAKEDFPQALFLNVSFVGSIPLLNALGNDAEGVIVTQVVPHFNENLPGIDTYKVDLESFDPTAEPSFLSLEGYTAANILVKGIRAAGNDINRETIIDGLESLNNIDVGFNVPLYLTPDSHQASHTVWPTQIKDGKYHPLEWRSLEVQE